MSEGRPALSANPSQDGKRSAVAAGALLLLPALCCGCRC